MTRPAALPLAQLSLRQRERALVVGGVGSGKSTLMDMLGSDFVDRYQNGRRLILDSKPRYRAQWQANGVTAKRRYKSWSHGQYIPGSYVADTPEEMELAFKLGARTVIVQCEAEREIGRLTACARRFLEGSRANRPQLLQVDETLDFYHANGSPKGGDDAVTRTARAGRERGTGFLGGTQRTHGLAATLMAEVNRLYGFRMDYKADNKRLLEMGAPPEMLNLPEREHIFMYWTKQGDAYRKVFGPYKLDIKER